jgi:hypothetical protein
MIRPRIPLPEPEVMNPGPVLYRPDIPGWNEPALRSGILDETNDTPGLGEYSAPPLDRGAFHVRACRNACGARRVQSVIADASVRAR